MKERPIQYFSDDYLEQASACSTTEIAQFLEDMRLLHHAIMPRSQTKLISLKIPEQLLTSFKTRCKLEGSKYQTKIKELMVAYLNQTSTESNEM
jgi:predicted DNA binding CopG/RHH family protein